LGKRDGARSPRPVPTTTTKTIRATHHRVIASPSLEGRGNLIAIIP